MECLSKAADEANLPALPLDHPLRSPVYRDATTLVPPQANAPLCVGPRRRHIDGQRHNTYHHHEGAVDADIRQPIPRQERRERTMLPPGCCGQHVVDTNAPQPLPRRKICRNTSVLCACSLCSIGKQEITQEGCQKRGCRKQPPLDDLILTTSVCDCLQDPGPTPHGGPQFSDSIHQAVQFWPIIVRFPGRAWTMIGQH